MKTTTLLLSVILVMVMVVGSVALAQEETVFSGNLRLHYSKLYNDATKEWGEDAFRIHFFELMAKKQVGSFGVFTNMRIGDGNANYLYEGWISYKAPEPIGTFKAGLVPVPFGIFANGLYYPKGIPYDKNWMWDYDYGVRYDGKFQASDVLGVELAAAFLNNESDAGELGAFSAGDCPACMGDRNNISGRLGVALTMEDLLALKAGGSAQIGKLHREGQEEDDDKLGIAGDVTIDLKALPIPVSLLGEFINYSLGEDDVLKGNILMGQLDITPVQNIGMLDSAKLSLHLSMDTPTEGLSKTTLIGQLLLIMDKQFRIYAQVYGNKIEDVDDMQGKGMRVWLMYLF
jgi:hypothetical protein